jgi:hypothetical protein
MIAHITVALIMVIFTLAGTFSFRDRDSTKFPTAESLALSHKKLGKIALYWMGTSLLFGILTK